MTTKTNSTQSELLDSEKGRVLNRVRKMLALGNDKAASEGERDNALRMVHATLAKYNLSLGDAEVKDEKRIDSSIKVSPHAWARTVAHAIANLYFCEYFFVRGRGQEIHHYFVGRESNVITAQEMTTYAVRSINKEARAQTRLHFGDGKFERDFCKGAAAAIWRRCAEIRKSAEAQDQSVANAGTALVLASVYKQEAERNALVIAQKHGPLKDPKGKQTAAGFTAYHAGASFGNKVNLNRQVGASKPSNAGLLN